MAQGPSDTILVAIRITLRIRESKVRNPDPLDGRRFVLSEHSFLVQAVFLIECRPTQTSTITKSQTPLITLQTHRLLPAQITLNLPLVEYEQEIPK